MIPRVLILADNSLSASAIRRGMRAAAFGEVIGYVRLNRPCGADVAAAAPDVIVISSCPAATELLARISEARCAAPAAKLVLLASNMEPAWLAKATAAGIDAAIRDVADSLRVGALVREIAGSNVYHAFAPPPGAAERTAPPDAAAGLTSRELQILRLAASGTPNGAIAAQLWITEQTVKFHLSNVYRKFGVANRTQASRYAYVNGFLDSTTTAMSGGTAQTVPVAA